jgi:hypothetical protein
MTCVRNILTAIGVYWLCGWLALLLAMILPNAHTYSDTPLTAVVFGIEMQMGRALAAAIAGALVTLVATGKKPERWAFVIATLEIIGRTNFSRMPPERWYSIMKYTAILLPAATCIASAYLVAYFRSKRSDR